LLHRLLPLLVLLLLLQLLLLPRVLLLLVVQLLLLHAALVRCLRLAPRARGAHPEHARGPEPCRSALLHRNLLSLQTGQPRLHPFEVCEPVVTAALPVALMKAGKAGTALFGGVRRLSFTATACRSKGDSRPAVDGCVRVSTQ
jgi:hypothetical protein